MSKIIVVFPKKENATNIRNLLMRGGMDVTGVCTTGAQAINYADMMEEGVVVCGYKMVDMMYTELREYLPDSFEMLLVASPDKWQSGLAEGVVGLSMPIKVYELIDTVTMMTENMERRRRKRRLEKWTRSQEQQTVIVQAKELPMTRNHMTEEEAHRYLQKSSMDRGTNMVETAQMILSMMSE